MEPATMMGVGALLSGAGSIGSLFSGGSKSALRAQENMHGQNLAMQETFAKEGIRWRVADAKAAGIHPLYALGAQIPSYSPSTFIPSEGGGRDYGSALRGLGAASQDFGRAIDATRTSAEKTSARLQSLSLERGELENELLRSQIAREKAQMGPPLPMAGGTSFIPGQGDPERMGLTVTAAPSHVKQNPQDVTVASPLNSSMEPQAVTDRGFIWTGSGYSPVPSKEAKDRMEDMIIPEMAWSLRNNLLPNLGNRSNEPPAHLIPEGFNSWRWSYSKQEWQPHYNPHRARVPVQKGR